MALKQLQQYLSSRFYERDEEVHGLLLAALAREHVFLFGPPGTAKSELAREFVACLEGAKLFSWLLTRFTTPEELFGPVDLQALKGGSFQRITRGKLPEAEFAFLDEIWKANSAILNTLLSIMNERIFFNDSTPVRVSLVSCLTASNEIPSDESLLALYDRILLRYSVKYLSDTALAKLVQENVSQLERPRVKLADLSLPEEEVKLPADLGEAFVEIRNGLAGEGIVPSDRRLHRSVRILKANAYIEGRSRVEDSDLAVLANVLWDKPEQINTVKKIVLRAADPSFVKALELYEACEAAAQQALNAPAEKKAEAGVEAAARIKKALAEIEKLTSPKAKELIPKAQALQKAVVKECFGL